MKIELGAKKKKKIIPNYNILNSTIIKFIHVTAIKRSKNLIMLCLKDSEKTDYLVKLKNLKQFLSYF